MTSTNSTGYFKTPLKDFRYAPYRKGGHIVRKKVVLLKRVTWVDAEDAHHHVPRGFVFDLASLPVSGVLLSRLGRHQRASVLHDWFYGNKAVGKLWSDDQMSQAMRHDLVVFWRRYLINTGLFLGGALAWYTPSTVLVVNPSTMKTVTERVFP